MRPREDILSIRRNDGTLCDVLIVGKSSRSSRTRLNQNFRTGLPEPRHRERNDCNSAFTRISLAENAQNQ